MTIDYAKLRKELTIARLKSRGVRYEQDGACVYERCGEVFACSETAKYLACPDCNVEYEEEEQENEEEDNDTDGANN